MKFFNIFRGSQTVMSLEEILLEEIKEFNASEEKDWMLKGQRYYEVENDITTRKIVRQTEYGEEEDKSKANNKLAHGFVKNLVDEKVAYLLTKEYSLDCEDENYIEKVKDVLGKHFQYKLSNLGYEVSNKGKGWLHPYIDEEGKFQTMIIPSEQCIPLWKDAAHTELDAMIRVYLVVVYEGREKKYETKVEYHTANDVSYYVMREGQLIKDIEVREGGPVSHYTVGDDEEARGWGKVPFIAFKNNRLERPDLKFIKSLVDGYDKSRSNVENYIDEVKNLIYVLKGYGGQSLKQFMDDLNYYRAVSIDDPEFGGVDTLTPKMDIQAPKEHTEQLKRDINEFGGGVNKDLDKFGSAPSGIALKFLYSGLDLKCNHLEVEFKMGFENLLHFVNIYLGETNQGNYSDIDVEIIFNRDVAINETESIENIVSSEDIISLETRIAQHPWVTDVEEELKKVLKEREEKQKEQAKMFGSDRFSKLEDEGEDDEE